METCKLWKHGNLDCMDVSINTTERNKAIIYLAKDSTTSFETHEKASILKKLYSQLATNLVKKTPIAFNNNRNEFQLLNVSEDIAKNIL